MSVLDRFGLHGKVALLSGAGRGIGAASALALAEAGADIAVLARTADQIERVAAQARDLGVRAIAIPTDANDAGAVRAAVARTVAELGRLDIVVHVVGGAMPRPFVTTTEWHLQQSFQHNVINGIQLVQEALPHLIAPGDASVVMISSTVGHNVARGYLAYGAAKAALEQAVRLMAADLNPRIRVNAVAPGAILTAALEVIAADPAIKAAIEAATPLRRLGEPDDIAAAVLYLASPASSYVTGQIIHVDGGVRTTNFELPIPDVGPP